MASEYVENVAKLCDVRILKSLKLAKCSYIPLSIGARCAALCVQQTWRPHCVMHGNACFLFVEVLQVIALFKYVTFPTDRDVDNAPPVALILLPRKFVVALVILDVGKVPLLVRKIP